MDCYALGGLPIAFQAAERSPASERSDATHTGGNMFPRVTFGTLADSFGEQFTQPPFSPQTNDGGIAFDSFAISLSPRIYGYGLCFVPQLFAISDGCSLG